MPEKVSLPVSQECLEKLEERRQKWGHAEWDDTIGLALEIVDPAEFAAKVAERIAQPETPADGQDGGHGAAQ